jgi:spore coat polysaccharide biosynthesis protein SpsF
MSERTVAIIQARMRSTRLPGKVLRVLAGTTVLGQVIRRVRACALIDATVVATSTAAADDPIIAETEAHGAQVFRGSEEDVLARYLDAATEAHATRIVRVTSDCPLLDPELLCRMVALFAEKCGSPPKLDYLSNTLHQRTFPRGLDAEIFTLDALSRAAAQATDPWDREHVTPYLYSHPEQFRLAGFRQPDDLSRHRWTLDTEEDWALLSAIYEALGAGGTTFTTRDVLDFLAGHPELAELNAAVPQKQRAPALRSG